MELDAVLERGCSRDWETVNAESTETVQFAVIGLGWFTKGRVLPALGSSDRCKATVLISSTEEKASRVASEYTDGATGLTYDQFQSGVAVDEYDAVYICTPNALHLEHAEAAAEFGKDVLCEKPVERSAERAERLVSACNGAGVRLMVAYRMHTEPAVRRAKEILDAGMIGRPMHVDGSMSQRLLDRIDSDPDQWRLDADLAGGGALFDIGLYPLNTARFLLERDPRRVFGDTDSTHDAFDEVDETVSFTAEFDDVNLHCFASHNARQRSHITVTGTEGVVGIDPAFFQDQERTLYVSRGDGRASVTLAKVDQMREEFDYFADRVRSGNPIYADGEHALVDMRTMEAVYESDRTGHPVSW